MLYLKNIVFFSFSWKCQPEGRVSLVKWGGAVFPLRLYVAKCQPEGRVSLVKWGGAVFPLRLYGAKCQPEGPVS